MSGSGSFKYHLFTPGMTVETNWYYLSFKTNLFKWA